MTCVWVINVLSWTIRALFGLTIPTYVQQPFWSWLNYWVGFDSQLVHVSYQHIYHDSTYSSGLLPYINKSWFPVFALDLPRQSCTNCTRNWRSWHTQLSLESWNMYPYGMYSLPQAVQVLKVNLCRCIHTLLCCEYGIWGCKPYSYLQLCTARYITTLTWY